MDVTTHDCDINNPECVSALRIAPWETDYAALVPRFTGSLSAISSTLIIYVILRSETRLSSIYHRIMFGMSLADICGSIAMALTSLPMPSYMPKEEIFGYKWAGTRLGNTYTCNAQGFFSTFGTTSMLSYNTMLCIYYACAIAFVLQEKHIKKYVEPIIHGLPILLGLSFSVPPLFYEMYNPGISAFSWCGSVVYPIECYDNRRIDCIRGTRRMTELGARTVSVAMCCVFSIALLALCMVIFKVIQNDWIILKLPSENNYNHIDKILDVHRNTKAALIQAFSYIVAMLLVLLPPILLFSGAIERTTASQVETAIILEKIALVLFPLQGFFNVIIFVSFKVYNYRRVRRDVGICHVLGLLFFTSAHDPCFISRISIVRHNEEDEEGCDNLVAEDGTRIAAKHNVYEIDVDDESNEELHFRLTLMQLNPEIISHGIGTEGIDPTSEVPCHRTTLSDPLPRTEKCMLKRTLSHRKDDESIYDFSSNWNSFSSETSNRNSSSCW